MRHGPILPASVLVLAGSLLAGRAPAGDAPPVAPPAPAVPEVEGALPRQTIDLGGGVTFEMVRVPAGEFDMGSPGTEVGRLGDEGLHRVRITKPFWLGTTELTQAAWTRVTGGNPAGFEGPSLPVTDVSWEDARSFLGRLNERVAGGGFRLPTEAEWEYACRAGSRTRFCCGDDERTLVDYAWYEANSGRALHAVGTLRPNAWGLHDMHGNVWEWCQDGHRRYPAVGDDVAEDPVEDSGTSEGRVQRGGCWLDPASRVRSACRSWNVPTFRYVVNGLRLARTALEDDRPPRAPGDAPPAPAPSPAPKGPREPAPPAPVVPAPKPGEPVPPGVPPAKEGDVPSWAKVAPEQVAAAKEAGVPVAFENALGMRFVLIPAGTFTMGSPDTESLRPADRAHDVTLTKPYYIGVEEVTNGQYRAFDPNHDSGAATGGSLDHDDQPVVRVSWDDAKAFVDWLAAREGGRAYRLPTEAEWERACRAGTSTPFWWGASLTPDRARYDVHYGTAGKARAEPSGTTVPVGTLPANPWGLHEVHGNVGEWCADWLADYATARSTDPSQPVEGAYRVRVIRGGSWRSWPMLLRSAVRFWFVPGARQNDVGFRVAVSLPAR